MMKNDFLRQICAPILSQFGFEFLWKHFEIKNNNSNNSSSSSSIIDLVHYCQILTYAERLQLILPKSLSHNLLPEISNSDSYFGGFGSSASMTDSSTTTNTLIPSFWMNAFRTLQFKSFYPPPLSTSRQKQVHNYHQNNNKNSSSNEDDLLLLSSSSSGDENTIVALSILRRNRFAAKVEATSSFHQKQQQESNNNNNSNRFWIELYKSFLSSTQQQQQSSLIEIPTEILNQMQRVLAIQQQNSNTSSSTTTTSFDPIMLATYFFTCSSSVTESGRFWTLEKMFSPIHEIVQSFIGNNSNNSSSSLSFSWLLSSLVLIDIAVSTFKEEEDNQMKQNLFEAAFVRTMLQKILTLMNVSVKPLLSIKKSDRLEPLPLINIMKFDTFICGFSSFLSTTNKNNDEEEEEEEDYFTINHGAASFRNAFCKYGIVQHEFRKIIRASWQTSFEEERKEEVSSSKAENENKEKNTTNIDRKIQRIHFTVSELFSLLTVVLSRVHKTLTSSSSFISLLRKHNNEEEDSSSSSSHHLLEYNQTYRFVSTTLEICSFLASEWKFALETFITCFDAGDENSTSNIKSKIAGNVVTSVIELCDSCLTIFGQQNTSASVKRLVELVEKIKEEAKV